MPAPPGFVSNTTTTPNKQVVQPSQPAQTTSKNVSFVAPSEATKSIKDVKEMQQEIIAFHNDLQKSSFTQAGAKNTRESYEPFLTYLLDNYAKKSGLDLTQYNSNDPTAAADARTGEFESWRKQYAWGMRQILDSLNRVGEHKPNKDTIPDGFWGILTNRALQNVAAFAHSLVELSKDIKIPNSFYTNKDLAKFETLIPVDPKDDKTRVSDTSNALIIRDHIRKIRELWKYLKEKLFEPTGQYGKQTGQEIGFPATISSKKINPLHQDLKKIFIENKDKEEYPKEMAGGLLFPVSPTQRWEEIYDKSIGTIPSNLTSQDVSDKYEIGKAYSRPVELKVGDLSSIDKFKKFLDQNQVRINGRPASSNLSEAVVKVKSLLGVE